ncbi:MAG: energy-coupling factor ABC transporter substrate-binding protein [Magnetococcales bacterium]|nr:energy-coupling factor ABC transporter substrate-binding protein [Magnetococcales bacterium]MBF0321450.1 energy-coupling factor ABC transporter substrate-binding protein [Magnetococcales bacterium]
MLRDNRIVLTLAVLILLLPFVLPWSKDGTFTGSDDQAGKVITQYRPDYQPWFTSLWTPPSSEVASLLFALQAALGSSVIGYYIGLRRGRRQAASQGHARS